MLPRMPADATQILTAVKAKVEATFAGKACHVRRGSEMNQAFWFDTHPPCFIVTCNEPVETQMAWAGKKFCKYRITLGYYTIEQPGQRDDSDDVRDTVAAAAKLFLAPRRDDGKPGLQGVANWNDSEVRPGAPYTVPTPNKTANCSPLLITVETVEDAA